MHWQTILSILIMAAMAGLGALLTQYPADAVPHWIPVTMAVLGAVGAAFRGLGVTNAGAAPPTVPK